MTKGGHKERFIIKASQRGATSFRFRHPLGGGGSEIEMTVLGRPAGLKRIGVNFARVPPGKEAFVYHRHHAEEEWVFILEGRAVSDIENKTEEVGPGDFIAYPAGVAHNLKNIGESDLVYLMGGERSGLDVGYFPDQGKTMVFSTSGLFAVDDAGRQVMHFADYLAEDEQNKKG